MVAEETRVAPPAGVESRHALLAARRAQKAANVEPSRPGFFSRHVTTPLHDVLDGLEGCARCLKETTPVPASAERAIHDLGPGRSDDVPSSLDVLPLAGAGDEPDYADLGLSVE